MHSYHKCRGGREGGREGERERGREREREGERERGRERERERERKNIITDKEHYTRTSYLKTTGSSMVMGEETVNYLCSHTYTPTKIHYFFVYILILI